MIIYSNMHFLPSTATIILVGLFTLQCQGAQEGVIISGPQTQIVAPGDIAYFNCYARGTVYVFINSSDPYPQRDYEARGFNFTYISDNDEHNNTIAVEARPSNNNTRISCSASGQIQGQHAFEEGGLIIAGSPLRPRLDVLQERVDGTNNFTYHLNWSAPFTWEGFPIISYDITIYNQSNNETVTSTMHINGSDTLGLAYDGYTSGDVCYALNFSVSATNRIGKGEPALTSSGHPIVLGEIGDIETAVTFRSNGTPHFWMSFYPPRICRGYQTGMYNITISDSDGNQVYRFGSVEYRQSTDDRGGLVVKEVKSGLIYGKNYTLEVIASSLGTTSTKRQNFYTVFDTDAVCRPMSVGEASNTRSCSTTADSEKIILGLSVGVGAVLLTCCCFGAAFVLLCKLRTKTHRKISSTPTLETDSSLVPKQKPKKGKPSSLTLHAKNPIYDGALYEITPGESLKSLMSPCNGGSVPCTPLAESACRYTFDFPPRLPPPRKGSVSIPPKLETHDEIDTKESLGNGVSPDQQQGGDNEYMEMNGGLPNKKDCTYAAVKKTTATEDEYVAVK